MEVILIKFAYRLYLLCQEIIQHRKKNERKFFFSLTDGCSSLWNCKQKKKPHIVMPKFMLDWRHL